MAKKVLHKDALIQTTPRDGAAERYVEISCLVESIHVRGLVMKGYVVLAMSKLIAAATVESPRDFWSASNVDQANKAKYWKKAKVFRELLNGPGPSNALPSARDRLTVGNTHVASFAILRISESVIVLVHPMSYSTVPAARHPY